MVGLIGKQYGPIVAGLFLAFPAILPASATLIEKHEAAKKRRAHFEVRHRGRAVAGVYVAGTAMGSIGLLVFAVISWKLMTLEPAWITLILASASWLATSVVIWRLRKWFCLRWKHD